MKKKEYNSAITEADLKALKEREENLRTDSGDDAILKNREHSVDFAGEDLDIPGRKQPNGSANLKLKDEENKLYSLGSEHNENLEQDSLK